MILRLDGQERGFRVRIPVLITAFAALSKSRSVERQKEAQGQGLRSAGRSVADREMRGVTWYSARRIHQHNAGRYENYQ